MYYLLPKSVFSNSKKSMQHNSIVSFSEKYMKPTDSPKCAENLILSMFYKLSLFLKNYLSLSYINVTLFRGPIRTQYESIQCLQHKF